MQPPPDAVPDAEFSALDQQQTEMHHQQLALAVPPAAEPLDPTLVGILGQTVQQTVGRLSGGQVDLPFGEPTSEVSPTLTAAVLGLQQVGQTTGHAFDAARLLTSNEGLKDLIGIVSTMGSDDSVNTKLQGQQSQTLPG